MIGLAPGTKVFLACQPIDLRSGFDGLAAHRIQSACQWIWPRDRDSARGTVSQPSFPEDARWNTERSAVEFGVEIGDYRRLVRVPRRVLRRLLPERPPPSGASKPPADPVREHRRAESPPAQLTEARNVEIGARGFTGAMAPRTLLALALGSPPPAAVHPRPSARVLLPIAGNEGRAVAPN